MKHLWFVILLLVSLGLGLAILRIDTRPAWDDTGITAGLVFLCTAAAGFALPARAWVFALAVSAWIPVHGLAHGHPATLLALPIGLAGAYAGASARRLLSSAAR